MIRLIIRVDDASMPAHLGGAVLTQYRTFDVDLPEIEGLLKQANAPKSYSQAQLVGGEIVERLDRKEGGRDGE